MTTEGLAITTDSKRFSYPTKFILSTCSVREQFDNAKRGRKPQDWMSSELIEAGVTRVGLFCHVGIAFFEITEHRLHRGMQATLKDLSIVPDSE